MNTQETEPDRTPGDRKPFDRPPIWIALVIAVALVGMYHDQQNVGENSRDYALATDHVEQQDATDGQVQIGSLQKKACFGLLLATGIYLAFVRRPETSWKPNRLAWLIACGLAWTALSYFWSSESSMTLRELLRLSAVVLVAMGIARNYSADKATLIVLVICNASVMTALASELAVGCLVPWADDYRLRGGMHANMVGLHATIMVIAALSCIGKAKQKHAFALLVVVGLVALLLTKSRTGVAACLVGMTILWSLRLESKRMALFWSSLVTVASIVVLVLAIGGSPLQRAMGGAAAMGRSEEIGSLTGRIPLWSYLSGYVRGRPMLGYGYEAFWTGERRLTVGEELIWYPTDAHSIYINTTLEIGLVGAGLALAVALVAAAVLVKAYRETSLAGYAFFATLIGVALLHGIAESACSSARIAGLCIGVGAFIAAGWNSIGLLPERSLSLSKGSVGPAT